MPRAIPADDRNNREFAQQLGSRLRAIRTRQHLSLHGVERKSGGAWKAVVIGSYERGDRAISVNRLAELADFYGVPLGELLPEAGGAVRPAASSPLTTVVLNVRRVRELTDEHAQPLVRMVAAIQHQRHDHSGERIAIRRSDLDALALVYGQSAAWVVEQLMRWQVLAPSSVILDGEP